MKNFGLIKNKILTLFSESYNKSEKNKLKKVLKFLNDNKSIKQMYLLYEDIEKIHIADTEVATYYVEEISKIIENLNESVQKAFKKNKDLIELLESVENDEYPTLYQNLDTLSNKTTYTNIVEKIQAKKQIVTFLGESKQNDVVVENYTENEKLLVNVLVNDFNNFYNRMLSEEEKSEMKKIMSLNDEELNKNFINIKENLINEFDKIINENNDSTIIEKITEAKKEIEVLKVSKYNLYNLITLKNGII